MNLTKTEFDSQYAALQNAAGVVDCSDRTQIEFTGADRAKFLHNLCTNAVRDLPIGQGCEAFVLNVKGHIVGHLLLFAGPHSIVLETVDGQAEKLLAHFDRYLIREDVQLHDRTAAWGELLLAGPQAEKLLIECGASAPAARLQHTQSEIAGKTVWIRQVDLCGPASFLIAAPREFIPDVQQALIAAGAITCQREVLETARIEAGVPQYGNDITEENLPQEIDRDVQAISFTKGCYLGQETVARIDALGHVNRLLRSVKFFGETVPTVGLELFAAKPQAAVEQPATAAQSTAEKSVGQITSACWSPRTNSPLALALVKRGYHEPGTRFDSPAGPAMVLATGTG
ncbi:MAG TPA: glycine cleavage T C-terminal barrel domain-containing protein [Pirellulales bacterium]|jgi:folate-binding protein YgfZ